jgi:hypothetical protein
MQSGASIFYAQRADLVRELLDGTAESKMPQRETAWLAALAKIYRPLAQLERESLERVERERWRVNASKNDLLEVDVETRETQQVTKSQNGSAGYELGRWRFSIGDTGRWNVFAFCANYNSALWLEIINTDRGQVLYRGDGYRSRWNAQAPFVAVAGSTAEVVVRGRVGDWPVELISMYAKPRPVVVDDVCRRRVDRWLETCFADSGSLPVVTLVCDRQRTLDAMPSGRHRDLLEEKLDGAGKYLAIVVSDQPDDFALTVRRISKSNSTVLADSRRIGVMAYGDFVLDATAGVRVEVSAGSPRPYQLRIYRAELAGSR